jgi:hypothetical protein
MLDFYLGIPILIFKITLLYWLCLLNRTRITGLMWVRVPPRAPLFMNKEREKLYDKLDNLRDDYRIWAEFPCNKRGNSKSVDDEHAKFEREISDLQKKVANLSA